MTKRETGVSQPADCHVTRREGTGKASTRFGREWQLMMRAARLYYEDYLTQQQIATELDVSRPTVSRLLTQARREGIVQITIADPLTGHEELADELVRSFGLKQAVLVAGEGLSAELLRRRLGIASAELLQHRLNEGCQVGIGWGRTLGSVVEALDAQERLGIHVVPLIGGLGQVSPSFQVNELARRLAEAFGGTWQSFYIPAFVEDPAALDGLLRLPDVEAVMKSWAHIDVALVGIGHFASQRQSSMLFYSYIGDNGLVGLEQCHAVGDICGQFFDTQGAQCFEERRVIGIPLERLRALQQVIAVAGGQEKVPAILGALRGGYVDILVTDSVSARGVLGLSRNAND
jgi:DNA-binding transcriptional regulator LsrR (DeoR family)